MSSLRRLGRRTAWLMAGAAIGLAVVLLVAALAVVLVGIVAGPRSVLGTPPPAAFALCAIAAVLIGALLGFVPGVRELEVTGARAMLGARGELIVPEAPRAGHRVRTVAFVVLHQLLGLAVVSLLGMVLPGGVAALVEAVTGSATGVGPALPLDAAGRVLRAPLGLVEVAVGLGGAWPLGLLGAVLAPRLLGPTPADRLAAAQARADREEEHRRIARDLHDGIGHALTAIGIQAAAAQRVGERDPALVAGALEAVESTAREATAELDAVLAVLREEREAPSPTSPPSARSLDALLDRHRRAGMALRAQVELPADVAPLVSRHLSGSSPSSSPTPPATAAPAPWRCTSGTRRTSCASRSPIPCRVPGPRPPAGDAATGWTASASGRACWAGASRPARSTAPGRRPGAPSPTSPC